MVDNGYFWDYFINDEDPYIRQSIIEKDLRLGLKRLDNDEDRQIVQLQLLQKTNDELELDILKAYIDAEKEYGDVEENIAYQALALKYDALTTVPSTIEKTMTPAQLFATNHPAWAKTYYPETIAALCTIVRTLTNMGYQNRADYADIVLNMVDDYQNDDYHYLQEFHSDAILEVKDRLGYPLLN